jgi:hypothetical protein
MFYPHPTAKRWWRQWRLMAASCCHSLMRLNIWYFMSDMHKVMTTLILVIFVLFWLELTQWLSSNCYFWVFSAISFIFCSVERFSLLWVNSNFLLSGLEVEVEFLTTGMWQHQSSIGFRILLLLLTWICGCSALDGVVNFWQIKEKGWAQMQLWLSSFDLSCLSLY